MAAIPVYVAAAWLLGPTFFAAAAVLFVPLAIVAAEIACKRTQEKDPGLIVVDEWAGYFLTVALHPLHWQTVVAGFLVFRVLDVVKPFPARRFEHLPGGTGVVMDDGVACRFHDQHYYVTATTGGVDAVYRTMLWHNARWRLDVDVTNATAASCW